MFRTLPPTHARYRNGAGRRSAVTTPRIGRSVAAEKNPLIKASNALGYAARKHREAAQAEEETIASPQPEGSEASTSKLVAEEVANRLRRLGEEFASEQHRQEQAISDRQIATIQPLMEKARQYIA